MTLTRLAGFKTLDFPVTTAANFKQKDIEIGMALDITGSMRDHSADGSRKIDGLKKAFETFADRLIPGTADDLAEGSHRLSRPIPTASTSAALPAHA